MAHVRTRPGFFLPGAVLALFAIAAPAAADTYQNDGFVDNTAAGFQAGFVTGEIGAACFTPPEDEYPIQLLSAQLLFGGDREGATIFANMKIWRSGGDGEEPSDLIEDIQDIEFISATNAMNEVDLTSYGITVTEPWCIGVEMRRNGLPSIARDDDGTINAGNNWIFIDAGVWIQSNLAGLTGDWVIRTIGTPRGGGVGPIPDAGTDTGTDTGTDAGTDASPDVGPDVGPDVEPDVADTSDPGVTIDDVEQSSEDPADEIEITIYGQGFLEEYRYRVGPRTLTDVSVIGGTEAAGFLAADALDPGSYDVTVRGDFGEVVYSDGVFLRVTDVELAAPTAIQVTPPETDFGDSTDIVVIGDGFVDGSTILIDRLAIPSTTTTNATTLTGFVPGDHVDGPGEYELIVRNPDGQQSAPLTFEFVSTSGGKSGGCATAGAATPAPRLGWLAFAALGLLAARRRR